jgi:hypothetical protein
MTQESDISYKRLLTEDGSPTMSLAPTWEPMHALDGAFTETIYIYQPTAEKALKAVSSPRFLSMGLGLGYNEILVAMECLKSGQVPEKIYSYEKMEFLIEHFRSWVLGETTELSDIYDLVLKFFCEKYDRPLDEARAFLKKLATENRLELHGAFDDGTPVPACHGIFFDAFSSKTSPDLWTPEFLENFFAQSAETCFISTYACKGTLKRSLIKNGFVLDIQKGFGKKRQSTFAMKSPENRQSL